MKPIVVCGMDFSGTSLVAGMLHAAGVDMGAVETVADVQTSPRPIRYQTFEDAVLLARVRPHLMRIVESPLDLMHCIAPLYNTVFEYLESRATSYMPEQQWGVKSNALTFLALHPSWQALPARWVTTHRPLDDIYGSAFRKLGQRLPIATFLSIQYLAYTLLRQALPFTHILDFDEAYACPDQYVTQLITAAVLPTQRCIQALRAAIDPVTKGVVPCPQSGLLSGGLL